MAPIRVSQSPPVNRRKFTVSVGPKEFSYVKFQRSTPDHLPQLVSLFSPQQVSPFARTRTTTTNRQTSLLARSDGHVLVFVMKHPRERRVNLIHILQEPVLAELWVGQGLCERLGTSLHEVLVLGSSPVEKWCSSIDSISFLAKYAVL